MKKYKCEDCHDTGWVGDNGPGMKGNSEYHECECGSEPKPKRYPFDEVDRFLKMVIDKVYTDDYGVLVICPASDVLHRAKELTKVIASHKNR